MIVCEWSGQIAGKLPYCRLLMVLLAMLAVAGCWGKSRKQAGPAKQDTESRFLNTKADVAYVGDEACAKCHQQIAQLHAQHPMGRSLRRLSADSLPLSPVPPRNKPSSAGITFRSGDLQYDVSWKDGKLWHRERRLDAEGTVIHEKQEPVSYELGGGDRLRSFLIRRDDTLWVSPIGYYPSKDRWGLAAINELSNQHFNRPVTQDCLFCHANRIQAEPATINGFRDPIFVGFGIGCERCHGPGQLHVARHSKDSGDSTNQSAPSGEPDLTIVNPAHLEPSLRDAVCQQCHLGGVARVPRRGRQADDYRPGLPLHEYLAIAVRKPSRDVAHETGHVEQMHQSQCFQKSGNRLSCVSCHDPHHKPAEADKVADYRRACLQCHSQADDADAAGESGGKQCLASTAARQATRPADNCLQCHMPKIRAEVEHAAVSNHTIPRIPFQGRPGGTRRQTQLPIELFHRHLRVADDRDLNRDLAIAVMTTATNQPRLVDPAHISLVVEELQRAVQRDPSDYAAIEAYAQARFTTGRGLEGLIALREGLKRAPRHEKMLAGAAVTALNLGRWDEASDYAQQLLRINPSLVRYHEMLAQVETGRRRWPAAAEAARQAVSLDPASIGARQRLLEVLVGGGQQQAAESELAILMKMVPQRQQADLRRWFRGLGNPSEAK